MRTQRLTVRVQLLNSGRGFEVWLEGGPKAASAPESSSAPPEIDPDQLILSRGPLSYAYKLFKIELHASPGNSRRALRPDSPSVDDFPTGAGRESPEALEIDQTNLAGSSSEHRIDGRSFDGELQLHFYNKHLAASANQASRMADEATSSSSNLFAVVSVFIVQRSSDSTGAANKSDLNNNSLGADKEEPLDFMLNNVHKVPNEGQSIEVQLSRAQVDALVADKSQYVTYQGSMNRPPCSESVDWIITNKPLRVQVNKFQNLFATSLKTVQDNVRPVRPLYRRLLRTTINNNLSGAPLQQSGRINRNESTSQSVQTIADNCDRSTVSATKSNSLLRTATTTSSLAHQLAGADLRLTGARRRLQRQKRVQNSPPSITRTRRRFLAGALGTLDAEAAMQLADDRPLVSVQSGGDLSFRRARRAEVGGSIARTAKVNTALLRQ